MSLYEVLYTPPWSLVYFSIPVIIWSLCFAYCHFTFDPDEVTNNRHISWYEQIAGNKFATFVGGVIIMAMLRDTLVLFE